MPPTTQEFNQFRRLVGDFDNSTPTVADSVIESYLDDATNELTSERLESPVTTFDTLDPIYHPEIVLYGAINWWWQKAATLVEHHTQSIGPATQNASEKYDRAMKMIDELTIRFNETTILGSHVSIKEFSRFSKQTLTRYGGAREEDRLDSP